MCHAMPEGTAFSPSEPILQVPDMADTLTGLISINQLELMHAYSVGITRKSRRSQ